MEDGVQPRAALAHAAQRRELLRGGHREQTLRRGRDSGDGIELLGHPGAAAEQPAYLLLRLLLGMMEQLIDQRPGQQCSHGVSLVVPGWRDHYRRDRRGLLPRDNPAT